MNILSEMRMISLAPVNISEIIPLIRHYGKTDISVRDVQHDCVRWCAGAARPRHGAPAAHAEAASPAVFRDPAEAPGPVGSMEPVVPVPPGSGHPLAAMDPG